MDAATKIAQKPYFWMDSYTHTLARSTMEAWW